MARIPFSFSISMVSVPSGSDPEIREAQGRRLPLERFEKPSVICNR